MTKKKGILIGTAVILAAAIGIVLMIALTVPSDIASFANPNNASVEKIILMVEQRSGELPSEEQKVFTEAFQKLSGRIVEDGETSFTKYIGGITGLYYYFSDGHKAIFVFSPEDPELLRVTVRQGTSDIAPAEAYFRVTPDVLSRDSIESLKERVTLSYPGGDGTLPNGAV